MSSYPQMTRVLKPLFLSLFLLVFLSACGGGGGSGEARVSSPNNGVFSLPTNTIIFTASLGQEFTPEPITIRGSVSGASEDVFIYVEVSDIGVVDTQSTMLNVNELTVYPGDQNILGSGSHTDIIAVSVCFDVNCNNHMSGSPQTISVTYNVAAPEFTIMPDRLNLDAQFIDIDNINQQTFQISSSDYVFFENAQFSASFGDNLFAFAHQDAQSNVDLFGNREETYQIELSNISTLTPGKTSGIIYADLDVLGNNIRAEIPVDVYSPAKQLKLSDIAIGLASFPSYGNVQAEISVTEMSENANITWEASSNVDWLSVSASGDNHSPILLNANPLGLARNSVHMAQVTVSSNDADISNQETITVAFWVGSEDQPRVTYWPETQGFITIDPIRPFMYVATNIRNNNRPYGLDIINYYTGVTLASLDLSENGFKSLYPSPDGQLLYLEVGEAANSASSETTFSIYDINTFEEMRSIVVDRVAFESDVFSNELTPISQIIRRGNEDFLISVNGYVIRGSNGELLNQGRQYSDLLGWVISKDGSRICYLEPFTDDHYCNKIIFSDAIFEFAAIPTDPIDNPGFGIARLSDDGLTAYLINEQRNIVQYDIENRRTIDTGFDLRINDHVLFPKFNLSRNNDIHGIGVLSGRDIIYRFNESEGVKSYPLPEPGLPLTGVFSHHLSGDQLYNIIHFGEGGIAVAAIAE